MRNEYEAIVAQAVRSNRLVETAADHVLIRTEQMRRDQTAISNTLNLIDISDISGEALHKKVQAFVDRERKIFNQFDLERKKSGAARLPEQINAHKMSLILNRVHDEFATDESKVVNMFVGNFAPEESFNAKWPVLRTDSYWGSTRGVMESAKLICAHLAVTNMTCNDYIQSKMLSSIFHATPWSDLTPCFVNSGSKFFAYVDGTPAFGFVHGGYAFGGQREESKQAAFGPEDCSSILANWLYQTQVAITNKTDYVKLTPAPTQFSTLHQLYWWRTQQAGNFHIDKNVHKQEMQELNSSLYAKAYTSTEQMHALKTGDVFLLRTFNKANGNPDLNAIGGGHTGVVIDRDPDEPRNVLIFECARDMEAENPQQNIWGPAGCGIGSFSAEYEQDCDPRIKRTMFLAPKF